MATTGLASAAQAFDAIAADFDARFCPWRSVEAQRRAVRRVLAEAFPPGARLIEIGGGTGEDASWLARRGCDVLMTDASPGMVSAAAAKCGDRVRTRVAAAEDFAALADALGGERAFDGAYSVFAALNCVTDLSGFAEGIARLLRPGAELIIVVFGTFSPGEMLVEVLRGRPRNALRRLNTGAVNARLGGRDFTVKYHRRRDFIAALDPWFTLQSRQGVGVFVPPSAAEPWISRHPVLLRSLETLDRWTSRELAIFGDHILYRFVRTGVPA